MTAQQAKVFKSKVMRLAHQIAKQMDGNHREVIGTALHQAWQMMKAKLENHLVFVRKWVAENALGELEESQYYSKENKSDLQKFAPVFEKVGSKFVILQGNKEHETPKSILFSGDLVGKKGDTQAIKVWIPKSMMA
jgi:hypothetical protein